MRVPVLVLVLVLVQEEVARRESPAASACLDTARRVGGAGTGFLRCWRNAWRSRTCWYIVLMPGGG